MERRIPLFVGLAALGAVVIVGWSLARKPEMVTTGSAAEPVRKAPPPLPVLSVDAGPVVVFATSPSSPHSVAKLIADTASGDAATRAAAIAALAEAPRTEALPVLGRILTDGEPEVDRPLALRSLRDLALNQGDADGAIREAVRHAIYHGDDFTKADALQETLEIIEESQQIQ
jgi:hypothetical protein